MNIIVYPPDLQAVGGFDGGKITEQKPIGFPGEGAAVDRVGPLFYWSWFYAPKEGYIAPHPHRGFEIITYVVSGFAEHGDSLGTVSRVSAGGIQVMKTGSGVSHSERFVGPQMEGFQIWFEPDLHETLSDSPTYRQHEDDELPRAAIEGNIVKTVIGEQSPVTLKADICMWDITIPAGSAHRMEVPLGFALAALAFRGNGKCYGTDSENLSPIQFRERDFIVVLTTNRLTFAADASGDLRLVVIQAPSEVNYPLYPRHR